MERRWGRNSDHTRDPPTEGSDIVMITVEWKLIYKLERCRRNGCGFSYEWMWTTKFTLKSILISRTAMPIPSSWTLAYCWQELRYDFRQLEWPFAIRSSSHSISDFKLQGSFSPRTTNLLHLSMPVSSLRHSSSVSHRASVSFMMPPHRPSTKNVPSSLTLASKHPHSWWSTTAPL